MIVHHADRLHEGVTDRRSDKVKAAPLEILAHNVGLHRSRWNLLEGLGRIQSRLPFHKLPDVRVETAEFFLYAKKGKCIGNGGGNLELVPDDAGITQQPFHFPSVITRHALRIESLECFPVVLAFIENRIPAQSSLRALENEKFKQLAILVYGHAPFFVMIAEQEPAIRPPAANRLRLVVLVRGTH